MLLLGSDRLRRGRGDFVPGGQFLARNRTFQGEIRARNREIASAKSKLNSPLAVLFWRTVTVLRACYAMSGTDLYRMALAAYTR
eukprot:3385885-Rhodomonas_salina.2